MAGLRPGHPRLAYLTLPKTWMPGTSPGMTIALAAPSGRSSSDILQPAIARLDAPDPHHHDLNHHKADHQPDHARQLVRSHQATDDERRYHGGAAAERVADAVGAQPDLGREQFRRIDAEQERGLHIDRDDQHEADTQH